MKILLVCLLSFISHEIKGQSLFLGEIRIHEVYETAKSFSDKKFLCDSSGIAFPEISNSKVFSNFNFHDFSPVNGIINHNDYFVVSYNSNGEISHIEHFEKDSRISNFDLELFYREDVIIGALRDWADDFQRNGQGYDFLPGFFVFLRSTKQIFFINTYPSTGQSYFSPSFPTFGIENISSISVINSDFYVTHIFRFQNGKLKNFSKIIFENDGISVVGEGIYYYTTPKKEIMAIDESTTFKNLLEYYSRNEVIYNVSLVSPCINSKWRHLPLWIYAGSHDFCLN